MPSKLREDARCPVCGRDISSIARTTQRVSSTAELSALEFYHVDDDDSNVCSLNGMQEVIDCMYDSMTVRVP